MRRFPRPRSVPGLEVAVGLASVIIVSVTAALPQLVPALATGLLTSGGLL